MNALRVALGEYLATRGALGYKMVRAGKLLPGFVDYLEQTGSAVVTRSLAVAWATQPRDVNPAWWTARLVLVRGFAKHLQAIDPRHEVPPLELLPHKRQRAQPYIYQPSEITALLAATAMLRSPLMTATYRTFVGLLAATGLRLGEAVALDEADVDRRQGVLLVRTTKFRKTREVPLHPTTTKALTRYVGERDRLAPRRRTPSFFVSTAGTRLLYQNAQLIFLGLVEAAGLAARRPHPSLHDLRHTFAVRTVLGWYHAGADVEAKLPTLSTYLGHIGPASTYWYLTAVPELLGAATVRLERVWGARP